MSRRPFARTEDEFQKIYQEELARDETKTKRAITRRRAYARLCKPAPCLGSTDPADPCKNFAIPGGNLCSEHGGNVVRFQSGAQVRLMSMVGAAIKAVGQALASSDPSVSLKAAQMIFDRTGFHAKATLEIEDKPPEDLRSLPSATLLARAKRQIAALEAANNANAPYIEAETIPLDDDLKPTAPKDVH